MVQLMEAWFLADKESLQSYFGDKFNSKALPARKDIEKVDKDEVQRSLKNASRSSAKGRYDKKLHSYEILGIIEPSKVERASTHAARLFDKLRKFCVK